MTADNPANIPGRATRDHWVGIVEHAHDKIKDKIKAARIDTTGEMLERFERELGPHLAPFLSELVSNPDVPEPIRDLLGAIAEPEHFTQSLLIGIALGAVISPVLGAATAPFIQSLANTVWAARPTIPLSPPEIALGVLRHNPHIADPAGEAAESGLSARALDALIYNTGEAIAVGELLQLYRRGLIDQARLVTGLRQSRIRDEWLPEVLALRYQPPGTGTVIEGAIKGHLSDAEASKKIAEAGTDPANYQWLKDSAGRPPGIEQMLHLWNRGAATEADVEQAIKQSDINPNYTAFVKELRWYIPPVRTIVALLRQGAVSEAEGRTLLAHQGVRPTDIDAYVAGALHTSASTQRHVTAAQVVRMYEARFLDRPTALARLAALRFPSDEATLMLDYADDQVTERLLAAAVNKVGTAYVAHRITKPEATAALGELALGAAAVNEYFAVWDVERATLAPNLTVAQLQGLLRRGIITHAQFLAQSARFGYDANELDWLAELAFPPPRAPKAAPSKDLSASQIVKLLQEGTITHAQAVSRLQSLGYSQAEAEEIIGLAIQPSSTP